MDRWSGFKGEEQVGRINPGVHSMKMACKAVGPTELTQGGRQTEQRSPRPEPCDTPTVISVADEIRKNQQKRLQRGSRRMESGR